MVALGIVLFCLQAVFLNEVLSQSLPCNANNIQRGNAASSLALSNSGASCCSSLGNGNIEPLTITSASFTPISSIANQAGIPTISAVVPNLQCGDISLSGDLPIGGTIKVSGCFPVYGMVELDGIVPSSGTAVASSSCQFPAGLAQNANGCIC